MESKTFSQNCYKYGSHLFIVNQSDRLSTLSYSEPASKPVHAYLVFLIQAFFYSDASRNSLKISLYSVPTAAGTVMDRGVWTGPWWVPLLRACRCESKWCKRPGKSTEHWAEIFPTHNQHICEKCGRGRVWRKCIFVCFWMVGKFKYFVWLGIFCKSSFRKFTSTFSSVLTPVSMFHTGAVKMTLATYWEGMVIIWHQWSGNFKKKFWKMYFTKL